MTGNDSDTNVTKDAGDSDMFQDNVTLCLRIKITNTVSQNDSASTTSLFITDNDSSAVVAH